MYSPTDTLSPVTPQETAKPASAAPEDTFLALVNAIQSRESGGNPRAVSPQGATGSMQLMPETFKQYARPGESYDNDEHRSFAGIRKLADDFKFYGGDVAKTAAAYIGGRGAVKDGQIRSDVKDALGTTPAAYAQQVVQKMGRFKVAPTPSAPASDRGPDIGVSDDGRLYVNGQTFDSKDHGKAIELYRAGAFTSPGQGSLPQGFTQPQPGSVETYFQRIVPASNTGKSAVAGWENFKGGWNEIIGIGQQLMGRSPAENTGMAAADVNRRYSTQLGALNRFPQTWDSAQGAGGVAQLTWGKIVESAPYMAELIGPGVIGGMLKAGAMNMARRAAFDAATAKGMAPEAAAAVAAKVGEEALALSTRYAPQIAMIAAGYPSAVGDVAGNMREQDPAGGYNIPAAAGLGVPYVGLNLLGGGAQAVSLFTRGTVRGAVGSMPGVAGRAARGVGGMTVTGAEESLGEYGQEWLNQAGRRAVDPRYDFFSPEAVKQREEAAIIGGLVGGAMGGVGGAASRAAREGKPLDLMKGQDGTYGVPPEPVAPPQPVTAHVPAGTALPTTLDTRDPWQQDSPLWAQPASLVPEGNLTVGGEPTPQGAVTWGQTARPELGPAMQRTQGVADLVGATLPQGVMGAQVQAPGAVDERITLSAGGVAPQINALGEQFTPAAATVTTGSPETGVAIPPTKQEIEAARVLGLVARENLQKRAGAAYDHIGDGKKQRQWRSAGALADKALGRYDDKFAARQSVVGAGRVDTKPRTSTTSIRAQRVPRYRLREPKESEQPRPVDMPTSGSAEPVTVRVTKGEQIRERARAKAEQGTVTYLTRKKEGTKTAPRGEGEGASPSVGLKKAASPYTETAQQVAPKATRGIEVARAESPDKQDGARVESATRVKADSMASPAAAVPTDEAFSEKEEAELSKAMKVQLAARERAPEPTKGEQRKAQVDTVGTKRLHEQVARNKKIAPALKAFVKLQQMIGGFSAFASTKKGKTQFDRAQSRGGVDRVAAANKARAANLEKVLDYFDGLVKTHGVAKVNAMFAFRKKYKLEKEESDIALSNLWRMYRARAFEANPYGLTRIAGTHQAGRARIEEGGGADTLRSWFAGEKKTKWGKKIKGVAALGYYMRMFGRSNLETMLGGRLYHIFKNTGADVDFQVVKGSSFTFQDGTRAHGAFVTAGQTVNTEDGPFKAKKPTVLIAEGARTEEYLPHELLHAATWHLISTSPAARARFQPILDALAKVDRSKLSPNLQTYVESVLQKDKASGVAELVSYGFTNAEFQDFLKGVKVEGRTGVAAKIRNALEYFVNMVKLTLGVHGMRTSALAHFIEQGGALLQDAEKGRGGKGKAVTLSGFVKNSQTFKPGSRVQVGREVMEVVSVKNRQALGYDLLTLDDGSIVRSDKVQMAEPRGPRQARLLAVKGKGGAWNPNAVERLAEALADGLQAGELADYANQLADNPEYGGPGDLAGDTPERKQNIASIQWAKRAVRNWLNKYAGTEEDPLNDIEIPYEDGTATWEHVTDRVFGAREITRFANRKQINPKWNERPDEQVWDIDPERDDHYRNIYGAEQALISYLRHTSDYLAQNVVKSKDPFAWLEWQSQRVKDEVESGSPRHVDGTYLSNFDYLQKREDAIRAREDYKKFEATDPLAQYDLVRAVKETAKQDEKNRKEQARNEEENRKAAGVITRELKPFKEYPQYEIRAISTLVNPEKRGIAWYKIDKSLGDEQIALQLSVDTMMAGHCVGACGHNEQGYKGYVPLRNLVTRHKVGSTRGWNQYAEDIKQGITDIYSLRDENGTVYATVEAETLHWNDAEVERRWNHWMESARESGLPPSKINKATFQKTLEAPPVQINQIKGINNGPVEPSVRFALKDLLNAGDFSHVNMHDAQMSGLWQDDDTGKWTTTNPAGDERHALLAARVVPAPAHANLLNPVTLVEKAFKFAVETALPFYKTGETGVPKVEEYLSAHAKTLQDKIIANHPTIARTAFGLIDKWSVPPVIRGVLDMGRKKAHNAGQTAHTFWSTLRGFSEDDLKLVEKYIRADGKIEVPEDKKEFLENLNSTLKNILERAKEQNVLPEGLKEANFTELVRWLDGETERLSFSLKMSADNRPKGDTHVASEEEILGEAKTYHRGEVVTSVTVAADPAYVYVPVGADLKALEKEHGYKIMNLDTERVYRPVEKLATGTRMWSAFTYAEGRAMMKTANYADALTFAMHGILHDTAVAEFANGLVEASNANESGSLVYDSREALAQELGSDKRIIDEVNTPLRVKLSRTPGYWVQLGNGYGELSNHYVPATLYSTLTDMSDKKELFPHYSDVLQFWKKTKTAWSPPTHFSNIASSFIMMYMNDIPMSALAESWKTFLKARAWETDDKFSSKDVDVLKARALWKQFEHSGALVASYNVHEITSDLARRINAAIEEGHGVESANALVRLLHALERTKVGEFGVNAYQNEDNVFRFAAFLEGKRRDMSDDDAGKFAADAMINYSIDARYIKTLRATFMPFIAWPYRMVPMLFHTMLFKPWKAMTMITMLYTLNALSYAITGDDEDEERKHLPEYLRGNLFMMPGAPQALRLPFNMNEKPAYWNISSFMPLGNFAEESRNGLFGIQGWPQGLMPGGPLMTIAELGLNKDAFTGKPIYGPTDTGLQSIGSTMKAAWQAFAPNLPVVSPRINEKLYDLLREKHGITGSEAEWGPALLAVVGPKLVPLDEREREAQAGVQTAAIVREYQSAIRKLVREESRYGSPDFDKVRELQADLVAGMLKKIAKAKGEE